MQKISIKTCHEKKKEKKQNDNMEIIDIET